MNRPSFWIAAGLLSVVPVLLPAADFTIVNGDEDGEGLNDQTPVLPVGNNPGTTLGEQRLFAAQFVADIWGALLESDVTIEVETAWNPLTCELSSGVLGSAGPTLIHANFDAQAIVDTWYPHALANAIEGSDLDNSVAGISMQINSTLDDGDSSCLNGIRWYYGLDGNVPEGAIDVVPTILHELGHGLGFISLVNPETGGYLDPGGPAQPLPDIFSRFLSDTELGIDWLDMTDEQRAASAINDPDLVWIGANVDAVASDFVTAAFSDGFIRMHAPDPLKLGSSVSHWSSDASPDLLMEPTSSPNVFDEVDLTIDLFADIGWQTTVATDIIFSDGFE